MKYQYTHNFWLLLFGFGGSIPPFGKLVSKNHRMLFNDCLTLKAS